MRASDDLQIKGIAKGDALTIEIVRHPHHGCVGLIDYEGDTFLTVLHWLRRAGTPRPTTAEARPLKRGFNRYKGSPQKNTQTVSTGRMLTDFYRKSVNQPDYTAASNIVICSSTGCWISNSTFISLTLYRLIQKSPPIR